jgi:SAM-dependent methyltransferase
MPSKADPGGLNSSLTENRNIMAPELYALPRLNLTLEDCFFYHVMDLPGYGPTGAGWDLRDGVDDYLGRFDFRSKRVLEIGPASGLLTIEMERRGGQIVAVEVTDDPGWDFVPFPAEMLAPEMQSRRQIMHALKNSWWFVHGLFNSSAKMHYGTAYDLPEGLGQFDVALLASVLTHTAAPLRIIEQCARRSNSIIIAETFRPDLEGRPVCLLNPSMENKDWGTWWYFSTDFFRQYLAVLGFRTQDLLLHSQKYHDNMVPLFTLVARR